MKNAGCIFGMLCALVSAPAATLSVTYTYNVTASGDATNPPLMGSGTGSILPFGNMTWSDRAYPDLSTGAVTGTFTATFANGTLVGNLFEQADLSSPPEAVLFTQRLEVTGGTGAYLWYNGQLTGSGTSNFLTNLGTNSGSGTLNTAPEPGSLVLLPVGWLYFVTYRKLRRR